MEPPGWVWVLVYGLLERQLEAAILWWGQWWDRDALIRLRWWAFHGMLVSVRPITSGSYCSKMLVMTRCFCAALINLPLIFWKAYRKDWCGRDGWSPEVIRRSLGCDSV